MHDYYPIPSVESLHAQFIRSNPGDYKIVFHDYRTGIKTILESSEQEAMDALMSTLNIMLSKLNYPKYLYVRSGGFEFMDAIGPDDGTLLKVVDRYDSSVEML